METRIMATWKPVWGQCYRSVGLHVCVCCQWSVSVAKVTWVITGEYGVSQQSYESVGIYICVCCRGDCIIFRTWWAASWQNYRSLSTWLRCHGDCGQQDRAHVWQKCRSSWSLVYCYVYCHGNWCADWHHIRLAAKCGMSLSLFWERLESWHQDRVAGQMF